MKNYTMAEVKDLAVAVVDDVIKETDDERIVAYCTWYGQIDPRSLVLELCKERHAPCCRCGERVFMHGPVALWSSRDGAWEGDWSQQHGCGGWNTPLSFARHITFMGELDNEGVHEFLAEVDHAARSMVKKIIEKCEARGTRQ